MPPDDPTTRIAPESPSGSDPAPEPAASPTPTVDLSNYVSREDYARLEGMLARQDQILQQIAGGRQAAPAPVDSGPHYTDDQLIEMLESGEGRKILEAQRYINKQTMQPLAREFVQFRDNTVHTAATFNREIAAARGTMPHLTDPGVKRSMDEFMAQMPTEAHANPQALQLAYAHAIAQPDNFKRLVNAEVEAELRRRAQGDEPTGMPAAGAPAGRVPNTTQAGVPSVRDLLGEDAVRAIRAQGYRDADAWVRASQGGRYKNWSEYAKAIQADQAANTDAEADADYDRSLQ